MAMLTHCAQPAVFEGLALLTLEQHRAIAVEQMPRTRPVGKAQRKLQATAPVRPHQVWTLRDPRIEERPAALGVASLPGKPPGLGQGHELEVAVRLPEILDVANQCRLPVVERLAEDKWRTRPGRWVTVPVRRKSHRPFPAEEPEAAGKNALRRFAVGAGRKPG